MKTLVYGLVGAMLGLFLGIAIVKFEKPDTARTGFMLFYVSGTAIHIDAEFARPDGPWIAFYKDGLIVLRVTTHSIRSIQPLEIPKKDALKPPKRTPGGVL